MRKEPFPDNMRYQSVFGKVSEIINAVKVSVARSVNAAYWLPRDQFEQEGKKLAGYGEEIVRRLVAELCARYGRGFSVYNVWQIKASCRAWPILRTLPAESVESEEEEISLYSHVQYS